MGYEAAVLIAYVIGMTVAFVLNRFFVFERSSDPTFHQFYRFCLVNAFAALQVFVISVSLANVILPALHVTPAELIGHIVGVISPVATSYFLHKKYSFK